MSISSSSAEGRSIAGFPRGTFIWNTYGRYDDHQCARLHENGEVEGFWDSGTDEYVAENRPWFWHSTEPGWTHHIGEDHPAWELMLAGWTLFELGQDVDLLMQKTKEKLLCEE